MENKNNDFRSKTKKEEVKSNNFSKLDSSNELKSGPKKRLLGSNSTQDTFSNGNLDNFGKKEEDLRKKILNEDNERGIKNIANNISAESKGVDELAINSNKKLFHTKKKNKDLTIPIIASVVFVLIIGIVAAYFLINKDLKNENENPQQIIKSSMEAMNSVESYTFKGDFNFNLVNDVEEEFSLVMEFDGEADEKDSNNVKSLLRIKPQMTISQEGGSENVSLDLSVMSFGEAGKESAYLKLNDFDLGVAGIIYGRMIVPYKNNWYFLDMKELREKSGADTEEDFNSEEMLEKIKELLKKYEMIKFEKDLGDVKLGNIETYHYQVGLDSEVLLSFYIELFKIIPSSGFYDNDMEDFEAELEKNKEEIIVVLDEIINNTDVEIWIGKKDKMIYKMSMNGKYDQEFMIGLEEKINKITQKEESIKTSSDINNSSLSFDMTITMSNFNQPVEITEPEEAKNLMKILEEMTMGSMGGMMIPETDSGLDSDMDGLNDNIEEIYGTDKNNPDTDGDGYKDGEEVKNGYDPAVSGDARLDYDKLFNTR
ncbi:MAG: hypothetical protein KAU07_01800 [Candidatus Andersenbacteria bacterium]|nr:hypothetical protein [Candidatus Andersenbacteria bacterium]